MWRWMIGSTLAMACTASGAATGTFYGFIGGWAYDATGTVTNGQPLDFKRDLGLRVTDRKTLALGYAPTQPGWMPALDFDAVHIATDGQQSFAGTQLFGAVPLTPGSTIHNRSDIDDLELTVRWPWMWGPLTALGGFTLTSLNGHVDVTNASSGQQDNQHIQQFFPKVSLGARWQALPTLRLGVDGEYISDGKNHADAWSASLFWQCLGPVGLEAGYRQRRYKVVDGSYALEPTLAGARIGIRMEIPH